LGSYVRSDTIPRTRPSDTRPLTVAVAFSSRATKFCAKTPRLIWIGGKLEAVIRQMWRLGHSM
jgi:hypothetical protein